MKRYLRHWRLRLLVTAVALLAAGLVGGAQIVASRHDMVEQLRRAQLILAKSLAAAAGRGLSQAIDAVTLMSEKTDPQRDSPAAMVSRISQVTVVTELVDNMLVVNPDGRVVAQSQPHIDAAALPSAEQLEAGIKAFRAGRRSVYSLDYHTRNHEPALAIMAPISVKGQAFGGMVVGALVTSWHSIGNLDSERIGSNGYAFLLAGDGSSLGQPERAQAQQELRQIPALMAAMAEPQGVGDYSAGGEAFLAAWARVNGVDWNVVVRRPLEDTYGRVDDLIHQASLVLAGSLLVLGALLFLALSFFSKALTRWIADEA